MINLTEEAKHLVNSAETECFDKFKEIEQI